MGNLDSAPLPHPFTFATSLSLADVEEVVRRFRVSPPQNGDTSKFGCNATKGYIKTILIGVVEGVFMASQTPSERSHGSSSELSSHPTASVDVEALFNSFVNGKMASEHGLMSFEVGVESGKEKEPSMAPSSRGKMPKLNQETVNIMPLLGALVAFASSAISTLDKVKNS